MVYARPEGSRLANVCSGGAGVGRGVHLTGQAGAEDSTSKGNWTPQLPVFRGPWEGALDHRWLAERGVSGSGYAWGEIHRGEQNAQSDPATVNLTGTAVRGRAVSGLSHHGGRGGGGCGGEEAGTSRRPVLSSGALIARGAVGGKFRSVVAGVRAGAAGCGIPANSRATATFARACSCGDPFSSSSSRVR